MRYDYECKACSRIYEVSQPMESEPRPVCPEGHQWSRVLSASGIMGGVGRFSNNHNVQEFLRTGEPGVFKKGHQKA